MLPEVNFTESFSLPTYIVYLSWLFTLLVICLPWYSRHRQMNLKIALNISLILMLSGFIGARLFHVFYESWPFYREQPERIFYVWLGGFVFLGGAIPAVLVAALYLYFKKLSFREWADFFAPLGAIGYGLGRVSCFLSGCCYGADCDLPWAIQGRHPTQLYAVFWELGVAIFLLKFRTKILKKYKLGGVFWLWVFLHSMGRIFIEGLRDDFRGPQIFGYSVSSFFCLILVSLSTFQLILGSAKSTDTAVKL